MSYRTMLVLGLTLGFIVPVSPCQAAPLLVIDQQEFDFGTVPQNSKISHVYHLQNAGDDTLIISKVVPGCGCTKVPLEKSVLAPGEGTAVEIIFSTGQYNGPVTKHPRLETNANPSSRNLVFRATVTGRPDSTSPLLIRPYKLDLSQFGPTVRDQMKFTVSNTSDEEVSLALVSASNLFSVSLPDKIAAGQSAEGTIQLNQTALSESFEKSFTFRVNDSTLPRFTVPVKRAIQSAAGGASTASEASSK